MSDLAGSAKLPLTRSRRGRRGPRPVAPTASTMTGARGLVVDPYRAVVFPNRIREQRIRSGHPRLFAFAATIPKIPYIRLSKLERGEVFAREDELNLIASVLNVAPLSLLLDVDAPSFDVAEWFLPFADGTAADTREEAEFAMLLAAAVRSKRHNDPTITAARMDKEFSIPPVILSRLENAQKGLDRWNERTIAGLCKFFAVADEQALRRHVTDLYEAERLNAFIDGIAGPDERIARTRQRVAALKAALSRDEGTNLAGTSADRRILPRSPRTLPVHSSPLPNGLVGIGEIGARIEAPSSAGPRAFGVRVGRSPLGPGLPGQAILIADPDRYPQAGGLVVIREADAYRLAAIASDKDGKMSAYAMSPVYEASLDDLHAENMAAVIGASFIS